VLIATQLTILAAQSRRNAKRDVVLRTYEEIYRNSDQRNLLVKVSTYAQGREFDLDKLMQENKAFRDDVLEVLNYCEYLAMGVIQGILDEKLVKTAYRSLLFVMHTHFDRAIKETRMKSNDPESFRYFSQLIDMWRS
jgi:hypothetical protein